MPELIQAHAVPPSPPGAQPWVVACLCAQWCITCRDYRAAFEALARAPSAGAAFVWIDIEDDSDWMGEVEVENFPTLLIARGAEVRFFGTMLPHAQQLARLLASSRESDAPPPGRVDAAVQALAVSLQSLLAQR